MVTSTIDAVSIKMNFINGIDAQTGQTNTVPVYLGDINPATYDPDKAWAICSNIKRCLAKALYSVQEIKTSTISND